MKISVEKTSNKKVIAKKHLTNLHEMNSRSPFYDCTRATIHETSNPLFSCHMKATDIKYAKLIEYKENTAPRLHRLVIYS